MSISVPGDAAQRISELLSALSLGGPIGSVVSGEVHAGTGETLDLVNPADGRVVSNFIIQALRGEEITIYGDGEQTRSFCYVSDLVDGIY